MRPLLSDPKVAVLDQRDTPLIHESELDRLSEIVRKRAHHKMAEDDIQDHDQIRALFAAVTQSVFDEYRVTENLSFSPNEMNSILKDISDFAYGHRIINFISKLTNVSDVF